MKNLEDYFEDLRNKDTKYQVVVLICGFSCVRRDSDLIGEPVKRTEMKVRVEKLKKLCMKLLEK